MPRRHRFGISPSKTVTFDDSVKSAVGTSTSSANLNFSLLDARAPELDKQITFKGKTHLRVKDNDISVTLANDSSEEHQHEHDHHEKDRHERHHEREREKDIKTSVNLDDIKRRLDNLLMQANTPLTELNDKDRKDLDALIEYMRIMYGTSAYNVYLSEIKQRFANIPIVSGTVGAYFGGCLKTPDNPCSVVCAGSIPFDGNNCNATVIYVHKTPTGCQSRVLNVNNSQGNIILYIDPAAKNLDNYVTEILQELQKLGFDKSKVKIYQLDTDGTTTDITNSVPSNSSFLSNVSSNNLWIIGIVVIFIIILLFILMRRQR